MPRARSQREGGSSPAGFDPPLHDALTDLHAYVLLLEGEWVRVGRRIEALSGDHAGSDMVADLTELRAKMAEEVEALRAAAGSLRHDAEIDRAGRHPPDMSRRSTRALAGQHAPPPGSGSRPAA